MNRYAVSRSTLKRALAICTRSEELELPELRTCARRNIKNSEAQLTGAESQSENCDVIFLTEGLRDFGDLAGAK